MNQNTLKTLEQEVCRIVKNRMASRPISWPSQNIFMGLKDALERPIILGVLNAVDADFSSASAAASHG